MADTLIDFLRHGEPEGGRRFRGSAVDDPLSDQGWRQMWTAVPEHPPWQRIISSPLRRCHAFAEALAERRRLPLALDFDLREVGFGAWEGLSPNEVSARFPTDYAAFYQDPLGHRPIGAEPLPAFAERVTRSVTGLLQRHPGEHLLIISHAGVIRAALGQVLQATPSGWYRCRIDYAGLTRIRLGRYGLKLEFHNRDRLPEPMTP
jgi:alpha-ribazole phosphatase